VLEVIVLHVDIGELKQAEDEFRARKEALEAEVAERGRELEEKRSLIQEQREAIRELSTPVIRLWDGILALPLVGLIDSARAAQIMENVLQAIVAQRAAQVIIDITGVPFMDTGVASHLIKTMQAAELLGARCILVGISPTMAQTLVSLEVGFGRATTCATLQEGLREALSRMHRRVVASRE
jgi:rsbT co-antagonist protein RsbR